MTDDEEIVYTCPACGTVTPMEPGVYRCSGCGARLPVEQLPDFGQDEDDEEPRP